jgi:hypothetical protein
LNVLLANPGSHHLTRWEQLSICKDHTSHDTPTRNYVNATLGDYVNDNPINLGNSVNADSGGAATYFGDRHSLQYGYRFSLFLFHAVQRFSSAD